MADEKLQILIEISEKLEGLRKAAQEIAALSAQTKGLETGMDHSADASEEASRALGKAGISAGVLRSELGELRQEMDRTDTAGRGLGTTFRIALGTALGQVATRAVGLAVGAMRSLIATTIEYNRLLQDTRDGLTAIAIATEPRRWNSYNDAAAEGERILRLLEARANQTGDRFERLVGVFRETAAIAAANGMGMETYADLLIDAGTAANNLGIDLGRLQSHLQALLAGQVNQGNVLAQATGITQEGIRAAREQGRMYEYLKARLAPFTTEVTGLSAEMNRLHNDFRRLLGLSTDRHFGLIESAVRNLRNTINEPRVQEAMENIVSSLVNMAEWAVKAATAMNRLTDGLGFIAGAVWYDWDAMEDAIRNDLQSQIDQIYLTPPKIAWKKSQRDWDLGSIVGRPRAPEEGRGENEVMLDLARNRRDQTQLSGDPLSTEISKRGEMERLMRRERGLMSELLSLRHENAAAIGRATDQARTHAQGLAELPSLTQEQQQELEKTTRRWIELNAQHQNALEGIVAIEEALANLDNELVRFDGFAQFKEGIVDWLDTFPTMAVEMSDLMTGTMQAGIDGLSDAIYGLFTDTKSFGDAMRGMLLGIGQSMLRMISDIIARRIFLSTIGRILDAQDVASNMAKATAIVTTETTAGAAVATAWTPAAIVKGIATFGIAIVVAMGLMAAAMSAFKSRRRGGLVTGGPQLVHMNEEGEETVLTASATRKHLGLADALNRGEDPVDYILRMNGERVYAKAAANLRTGTLAARDGGGVRRTSPSASRVAAAMDSGGGRAEQPPVPEVNFLVVGSHRELREQMEGLTGQIRIIQRELGI